MRNSKIFTKKNGIIATIVLLVIYFLTKDKSLVKEPFLTTISNAENQLNQLNEVQPLESNLQLSLVQPKTTEIPSLIPINTIQDDILFINQNPIV